MIVQGYQLQMINDRGDIYYTTDGSDPRLEGGAVSATATMIPGSVSESTLLPSGSTDWRSR